MSQVEVDLKMSKVEYAKLNERMEKMEKLHDRESGDGEIRPKQESAEDWELDTVSRRY